MVSHVATRQLAGWTFRGLVNGSTANFEISHLQQLFIPNFPPNILES